MLVCTDNVSRVCNCLICSNTSFMTNYLNNIFFIFSVTFHGIVIWSILKAKLQICNRKN